MIDLYAYVLPQVFPWVIKHIDASTASDLASVLIESEVPSSPGTPPPPAGSSFAIIAGIRHNDKGHVDMWLSEVSKKRLENLESDLIFTVSSRRG